MEDVKLADLGITDFGGTGLGGETPQPHGIRVLWVLPDSSAEAVGVRPGDIILRYDQHDLSQQEWGDFTQPFREYIREQKWIGDPLKLGILRVAPEQVGDSSEREGNSANRDGSKNIQLEIQAALGRRPDVFLGNLPTNAELFPDFEGFSFPLEAHYLGWLEEYDLIPKTDEILARFDDQELWDAGLRNRRFRYLHRDPVKLIPVSERMVADLATNLAPGRERVAATIATVSDLWDETVDVGWQREMARKLPYPISQEWSEHLEFIKTHLQLTQSLRAEALSSLTEEEVAYLYEKAPILLKHFLEDGYYLTLAAELSEREMLKRVMALSKRVDFAQMARAQWLWARLADRGWLQRLKGVLEKLPVNREQSITAPGVYGELLFAEESEAGWIVVGGTGNNQYRHDMAVVIDPGGEDHYYNSAGGARSAKLSVAAVLDLDGDDVYGATSPVAQGSALLGIGMLVDLRGDDHYTAVQHGQGSVFIGGGMLLDYAGDDWYRLSEFGQGQGAYGVGLLIDLAGNDRYKAHNLAQGVGMPKGVAVLWDRLGSDDYFASGKRPSSYGTEGIFNGSSQGFGVGFRNSASGGIGMLADLAGEDRFIAGNFSQGGGYFYGLGILYSAGTNNDRYYGSRYSQGFSAHSAAGILLDEGGNDHYFSIQPAAQGAAWDLGSAILLDKAGDDSYEARGSFAQGASAHNGFALFMDLQGRDRYVGSGSVRGHAGPNDYHGGPSFSLFVDAGGEPDFYLGKEVMEKSPTGGEYAVSVDLVGGK